MKYNEKNKPLVCMMTQSTCYRKTSKMTPKGVLWHSTGANNPTLKRYVQPDDNAPDREEMLALLGKNQYGNDWNHIERQAGLNAWIGKLADGTITSIQTLPWDYAPWGCGSGSKGSCNNGWMQFEICEDGLNDKAYFEAAYQEACELTAYYCKMYNLNPKGTVKYNGIEVPVILCHYDSYLYKMGGNHGDVYHWFNRYGKTMEDVRNDVAKLMDIAPSVPEVKPEQPEQPESNVGIKPGSLVRIKESAIYYTGKVVPPWVRDQNWYVKSMSGDRVVINESEDGKYTINSPINIKYLSPVETEEKPASYQIRVTVDVLNRRNGPGTQYGINGVLRKGAVRTIVAQQNEWGKLESDEGWICLTYTTKE